MVNEALLIHRPQEICSDNINSFVVLVYANLKLCFPVVNDVFRQGYKEGAASLALVFYIDAVTVADNADLTTHAFQL